MIRSGIDETPETWTIRIPSPNRRRQRMNDHRLIELETRITYQDDTIRQLNDAVSRQQLDIARLERLCAAVQARLAAMIEATPREPAGDEKPPHY